MLFRSDFFFAVICECKEKVQDWTHEGKAIARMMGTKGMVSITLISAFKGCFFVGSARRTEWLQEQERLLVKGRPVLLRRWSPSENMVVFGKFRRGWLELKGLLFHLWDEDQLKFIMKKVGGGGGNEGGKGIIEACRLVEGEAIGGNASKCRATSVARGGRWGLDIHSCSFNHRRS